LFAAVVSADLTGEQGTWRTVGSLLARNTLMVQHAGGDTSRQAGALDELRRSGDEKSLALAARRLWAIGPLGPLAEAARRIQPGSWTHTSARANLALWQHAGDVLDEATASDAAHYCLDVVTDNSAFVSRTTPSFLVVPYTLDALSGLLGAADDAVHRDLARFIAGLPPVTDQLEVRGWARVAGALRPTMVAAEDRAAPGARSRSPSPIQGWQRFSTCSSTTTRQPARCCAPGSLAATTTRLPPSGPTMCMNWTRRSPSG
jgi:hypothetical protein